MCWRLGRGVGLRFGWGCLALLAGAFVYLAPNVGAHAAAPEAPPVPKPPLVAIIDSGIARTPELQKFLVAEYDLGATPARPAFQPRYDHGTMVATIMEREAKEPIDIVSFRIDDLQGCPQDANPPCQHDVKPIAEAIRKATEMGVSAINISLNLKDDPRIVDAVRDAAARGIKVVMAAGNDGLDHPGNLGMARAGYPNTVLVGALEAEWPAVEGHQQAPGRHYRLPLRLAARRRCPDGHGQRYRGDRHRHLVRRADRNGQAADRAEGDDNRVVELEREPRASRPAGVAANASSRKSCLSLLESFPKKWPAQKRENRAFGAVFERR